MDIVIGTPQRLGHLPLVVDVLRRIGLLDLIDRVVRDDPRSKVSTSDCVLTMMCAVFTGNHALWRVRERLACYDMATITRDAGWNLAEFPEERLAKMLDRLMTAVAVQTILNFRLDTGFLHFDTTNLPMHGSYEREDFASFLGTSTTPAPKVEHGYAKKGRADLKQVLFGSLVTSDGGVPVFGKALDGSRSDNEAAAEFFQQVRHLVADPRQVCCVADSKGWCARTLHVVRSEGLRLLSRLPRNHRLHRDLLAKPWRIDGRLELPLRSGQKAAAYYEFMASDAEEEFTMAMPGKDGVPKPQRFTVPVRALRVFSSGLLDQKTATLTRTRRREAVEAKRLIRAAQAKAYACDSDAQRDADRLCREHGLTTLDLVATVQRVEGPLVRGRGRPRAIPEPAIDQTHYRVTYLAQPADETAVLARLREAATFVLVRTRNDGWAMADTEMITRYKGQYHNEHGFAWLKSGHGINPIFLQVPQRIAALCFLYCIGLMVWNLIQRTVRANLAAMGTGLPYHRNKPSDRITTRFLFELFPQVQSIPITLPDKTRRKQLAGFDAHQQIACRALGTNVNVFEPVLENGG